MPVRTLHVLIGWRRGHGCRVEGMLKKFLCSEPRAEYFARALRYKGGRQRQVLHRRGRLPVLRELKLSSHAVPCLHHVPKTPTFSDCRWALFSRLCAAKKTYQNSLAATLFCKSMWNCEEEGKATRVAREMGGLLLADSMRDALGGQWRGGQVQ